MSERIDDSMREQVSEGMDGELTDEQTRERADERMGK